MPQALLDLGNRVAIVTGGAAGIGAAIVAALARAGARVMATDIDGHAGEASARALAAEGLDVLFRPLDVTDEPGWSALVEHTVATRGRLDILVNNAGICAGGLLTDTTLEIFRSVHAVNVDGVFLGMKHVARAMRPGGKAGRGGSIINLSSVAGLTGTVAHSAYGSTKGAVRALSRHGAIEFAALGYGIRVNSVHPGVVRTAMADALFSTFANAALVGSEEAAARAAADAIPMKRFGEPDDVAGLVVYLASDAASYVTGAEFVIDGGFSAR